MKRRIRLTEQGLHRLIKESVTRMLKENLNEENEISNFYDDTNRMFNPYNEDDGNIIYVNDYEDIATLKIYDIPHDDFYGTRYKFGIYTSEKDSFEDDIKTIVAYAEENGYDNIFTDEETESFYKELLDKYNGDEWEAKWDLEDTYIYVDAREEGATQPHFIYHNINFIEKQ